MRIGSLFSGAGGLDLAVQEVFGGEVVWHAEIDKAASSKVLAYRFPGVPNLGSVTDIDWATVPAVDVLCGGFPCQDVSAAGKRAGIKAGTRSGLWSVFVDAIDALRPQWVVIENVRGLLSATAHRTVEDDADCDVEPAAGAVGDGAGRPVLRAAGAVLGDLADLGYDAQWATVAAADVGAPHRRERVFIAASRALAYTGYDAGCAEQGVKHRQRSNGMTPMYADDIDLDGLANAATEAIQDLPGPLRAQGKADSTGKPPESGPGSLPLLPTPASADGQRGQDFARANREGSGGDDLVTLAVKADRDSAWGKYEPAIRRWEQIVGPAPAPTEPNKNGNPRLSAAFSEWLMGWPQGWVTHPDIGISRNDQLRIIGNGVCPQQAIAALRFLLAVSEVTA